MWPAYVFYAALASFLAAGVVRSLLRGGWLDRWGAPRADKAGGAKPRRKERPIHDQ